MKHINRYKVFESGDMKYSEILEEIDDILLDVSDMGYKPKSELVKDYTYHIFVRIINYENTPLLKENFKEVLRAIIRIDEFATKEGFKISKVYYKGVEPDGRIFNKNERHGVGYNTFMEYILSYNKKLCYLSLELKQMER